MLGLDGLERVGERGEALARCVQAAADLDQRGGEHGDDDDGEQDVRSDERAHAAPP